MPMLSTVTGTHCPRVASRIVATSAHPTSTARSRFKASTVDSNGIGCLDGIGGTGASERTAYAFRPRPEEPV